MTKSDKPKRGKKPPPDRPKSKAEAVMRMGRFARYLLGYRTNRASIAEVLIDATFAEINAVKDQDDRKALLRELLDRAYAEMVKP